MADRYAPALFLEVLAFWFVLKWLLVERLILLVGRLLVLMMVVGALTALAEHHYLWAASSAGAGLLPWRLAPKSRANALGTLHSLIEFAIDEGWMPGENPVKRVEKPAVAATDPDVHFLETEEVEALLRAVPDDPLGRVERVMYLTAAMTGMRQGELFALRWRDVDWSARRIRVRRNFVRGEFGTPKSKRSSRSVPLASRVATELELLSQDSLYKKDDDLVFAHPETGKPIDRSKLLKRFKAALRRADVRAVRFHDLRHTFGTRMAAQGMPMRVLQELMGHRDFKTTLIYADYAPSEREAEWVEEAFRTAVPRTQRVARLQSS